MKPTDFSYHLKNYLAKYLPGMAGLSTNTISSYRDMFTILIIFFESVAGIAPEKLVLKYFNQENIENFLGWLETERKNLVSTRNVRLAAIHAYAGYVGRVCPEMMHEMQKIQSIPLKKEYKDTIKYISIKAMTLLLSLPDTHTRAGRRDCVMLSLMYDSGCRVQEICDLKASDIRIQKPSTVKITGKGNKERIVPIMDPMARLMEKYIKEKGFMQPEKLSCPLFVNRSGQKLTRKGVAYILNKYFLMAREIDPAIYPEKISPHCLRHSKSIHLLQSGVNLIYIRDLLGHSDIKTTEVYARIDSEMKRKALERSQNITPSGKEPEWQANRELLEWLISLGR